MTITINVVGLENCKSPAILHAIIFLEESFIVNNGNCTCVMHNITFSYDVMHNILDPSYMPINMCICVCGVGTEREIEERELKKSLSER